MKVIFLSFFLVLTYYVNAQTNDAKRPIVEFQSGEIVTSTSGHFEDGKIDKSSVPYDEKMFAVYQADVKGRRDQTLIQSGMAEVKFTSANGQVKKGDYITSSSIPGTAMKATRSGMTIGVALEDSNEHMTVLKIQVQPNWVNIQ